MVSFLVFLLLFLFLILSFKFELNNKVTIFESGFNSLFKVQTSFSVHFFVIVVLFVVFDLEIVLMLGLLVSGFYSYLLFFSLFLFLIVGFYVEFYFGKLIWFI